MKLDLSERDVIYILNCININLHYLKYHTQEIKKDISYYYNFDNYYEDYFNLNLLHRRISVKANVEYYNINNFNLFVGQKDYLNSKEKDFKILKNNKNKDINKFNKKVEERKHNKFYMKFFFKRSIDKLKEIV
jgi:hypothetical protein|nr:MAG TPA: hypothetical protein [Inoviridae sp.]